MAHGMTHAVVAQVSDSLILITLLIKLGVAAAVSSSLARSTTFKKLLLVPRRSHRQVLALLATICVPLTLSRCSSMLPPLVLEATRAAMSSDIAPESAVALAERAAALLRPLAARAGAVINGEDTADAGEPVTPQAVVDRLMKS